MASSILNLPTLFLGLAHPVRNDENTNQLLNSYPPTLREILQLQENATIQNLHELDRLFTVAHVGSTTWNSDDTLWLYMAHLLFLENNVEFVPAIH